MKSDSISYVVPSDLFSFHVCGTQCVFYMSSEAMPGSGG